MGSIESTTVAFQDCVAARGGFCEFTVVPYSMTGTCRRIFPGAAIGIGLRPALSLMGDIDYRRSKLFLPKLIKHPSHPESKRSEALKTPKRSALTLIDALTNRPPRRKGTLHDRDPRLQNEHRTPLKSISLPGRT